MSLWLANDHSSSGILLSFFDQVRRVREKDAALRAAKLEYLPKVDALTAHPYYWSHFVIFGEMDPIRENGLPKGWLWAGIGMLGVLAFWGWNRKRQY